MVLASSVCTHGPIQPPSPSHSPLPSSYTPAGSPGADGSPSANGAVTDAVAAAMSTGIVNMPSSPSGYYSYADIAGPAWRPRGVLTAHLNEHRAAVNRLAVARGGAFFASASNDETVKVWDLRRLEKDVTFHSRLTYAAQVRGVGCMGGQAGMCACAALLCMEAVCSGGKDVPTWMLVVPFGLPFGCLGGIAGAASQLQVRGARGV